MEQLYCLVGAEYEKTCRTKPCNECHYKTTTPPEDTTDDYSFIGVKLFNCPDVEEEDQEDGVQAYTLYPRTKLGVQNEK